MRKTMTIIAAVAIVVTGLGAARAGTSGSDGQRVRVVEIAETGSRFVPDPDVVDANGVPTRGNYFVTEGYIYPQGTVSCTDGTCNGVLYDAEGNPSPEFPDRVIGTWTCYGTHVEDAATTPSGPLVATTQMYDLGADVGDHTIVTTGFELADIGVSIDRAVIGGTGPARGADGIQSQTLLGLNHPDLVIDGRPLFGVTLRVRLPLR